MKLQDLVEAQNKYPSAEHKSDLVAKMKPILDKYKMEVRLTADKFTPNDFKGYKPPVTWSGPGFSISANRPAEMDVKKWTEFRRALDKALLGSKFTSLSNLVSKTDDKFLFLTMTDPEEL